MPTLTVKRDWGWADKIRGYKILVDGQPVGVLKQGETIVCPIGRGPHTVEARIDWCGSPRLSIEVGDDDCSVLVRSNLRGIRLMIAMWYVVIQRKRYLCIEQVLTMGEAA